MRRLVAVLALAVGCAPLALAAPEPVETRLAKPPFPAATSPSTRAGSLDLTVVSSRRNGIVDEAIWLRDGKLVPREYRIPGSLGDLPLAKLPAWVPLSYAGRAGELGLTRAIRQPDGKLLLVYGKDFSSGRIVVGSDLRSRSLRYAYDFGRYAYAPVTAPGDRPFVYQQVVWAAETGGTLYVETAHSTYARSSGGRNGYLSAIDLKTRKLKWRSGPLVANAQTFEIVGGSIVAGYGFTAEPDFLYLLDRADGTVISRTAAPSAPRYLIRKGGLLYVRTYDHDLVVKLVRT